MKNRTRLWLMVLVVTLVANLFTVGAFAEATSGSCGANLTWTVNTETGELTISGTGAMNDYSSTTAPWKAYNDVITKVTVGEGVTALWSTNKSQPFNGLTKDFTVSLPGTLTKIDRDFNNCVNLTAVTFAKTGVLEKVDGWAFANCKKLVSITFPDNAQTKFYDGSFNNCYALTSVTLGNQTAQLNGRVFNNCSALTEIVIPASVTQVGNATSGQGAAFNGCGKLAKVTFLGAGTEIIPADATGIPASAVIYGVEGSKAVAYARSNERDFSIIEAGILAGGSCGGNITWSLSSDGTLTLSGEGAMSSVWNVADYNDKVVKVVVEEGITSLPKKVFNSLTQSFTIELPSSLEKLDGDFNSCTKLIAVTFAKEGKLKDIYAWTFSGCSFLESVVLPNNAATRIQNGAFNNCYRLTSVTLGDKTTSIFGKAFNNCEKLEAIVIPASVTYVGDATNGTAFGGCNALKDVTFLGADTAITDTFPASGVTVKGYIGSTAEEYAKANSSKTTFKPFATEITTGEDTVVFELTVDYTPVAEKAGQYLPLATLTRVGSEATIAIDLLYIEGATGALYVKSTTEEYLPFLKDEENLAIGGAEAEIAIVYNNKEGTARYYVNGDIPSVNSAETLAISLPVHNASFNQVEVVKDTLAVRGDVTTKDVFGINASGTADFVGFQVKTGDSKTIRVLAGVDMLYYGNVGFEVELYSEDILVGTIFKTTNTVFTSLHAGGDTVTAASKGYQYITAVEIRDIYPGDYAGDNLYFVIKPFTQVGAEVSYGESAKITIAYDEVKGENVYTVVDGY